MTRQEQIIQAAKQAEKKLGFAQIVKDAKGVNSAYGIGFLEGAKWADEHSIEVKDTYEQCIQHPSVKHGIEAHAETYSFNIESELFQQLTKEQQKLWRKEIEQACISGGEVGVELARDTRYKENIEMKEVDLDEEYDNEFFKDPVFGKLVNRSAGMVIAKHFFELGLKAQKGE